MGDQNTPLGRGRARGMGRGLYQHPAPNPNVVSKTKKYIANGYTLFEAQALTTYFM